MSRDHGIRVTGGGGGGGGGGQTAASGQLGNAPMAYFNQCVALADPTMDQLIARGGKSIGYRAKTDEDAKALALKECEGLDGGQQCRIIYSACSLSEFKSFR